MENLKYSFEGKTALVLEGISRGRSENILPGTSNTYARIYSVTNPVDAIALAYYNASAGNAARSAMFAKKALELCNVTGIGEVEALIELSIYSPKDASSVFIAAASQVDIMARRELFDELRRIEEPFPTD